MKTFRILFILLLFISPLDADAATVVLKNGMRLNAEKVWEEQGKVKCLINGVIISFPLKDVARVRDNHGESAGTNSETAEQIEKHAADADKTPGTVSEKSMPYAAEGEVLETELNTPENAGTSNSATHYPGRAEAETGVAIRTKRPVAEETEGGETLFDTEKFSKTLAGLVGRPVTEFIDRWGYPDTIYRIHDGTFEYLFVIEINPSFSLDVIFKTDPVGKILDVRSEERKEEPFAKDE